MKRSFILLVSLLIIFAGVLQAKKESILKVKVQTANVRSEADAAAAVIAKVNSGTLLEASGRDGDWYEVTVTNPAGKEVSGFIHKSVVTVVSGADQGEEEVEAEESRPAPEARRKATTYRKAKDYAAGGLKLMGGLSMGNLNLSEEIPAAAKKSSKMDFMGGLGFESGGQIAVEADLLYSPCGALIKPTDPATKGKLTLSGTAITLPLMLKVRLLKGTTPYILGGGEVGYILSQKVVLTAADGTENEEDITDDINRLYYGVCFGGGVELQAGGMNVLIEARYRLGLSNLVKEPDAGEYVKATALSFMLGIKF